MKKTMKGALGVEPRTYRTAADCSTTELYPLAVKEEGERNNLFLLSLKAHVYIRTARREPLSFLPYSTVQ